MASDKAGLPAAMMTAKVATKRKMGREGLEEATRRLGSAILSGTEQLQWEAPESNLSQSDQADSNQSWKSGKQERTTTRKTRIK